MCLCDQALIGEGAYLGGPKEPKRVCGSYTLPGIIEKYGECRTLILGFIGRELPREHASRVRAYEEIRALRVRFGDFDRKYSSLGSNLKPNTLNPAP